MLASLNDRLIQFCCVVRTQLAFFTMRGESKLAALVCLLRDLIPGPQQTIVFAATRCEGREVLSCIALCVRWCVAVLLRLAAWARAQAGSVCALIPLRQWLLPSSLLARPAHPSALLCPRFAHGAGTTWSSCRSC